eukprot:3680805-Prymnesium_polylepis.2
MPVEERTQAFLSGRLMSSRPPTAPHASPARHAPYSARYVWLRARSSSVSSRCGWRQRGHDMRPASFDLSAHSLQSEWAHASSTSDFGSSVRQTGHTLSIGMCLIALTASALPWAAPGGIQLESLWNLQRNSHPTNVPTTYRQCTDKNQPRTNHVPTTWQ